MRKTMLCLLATLLPLSAIASDRCAHSAPRNLSLDLKGIKTVVFEIRSHDLKLRASKGATPAVRGQACASDADTLPLLTLTQERIGDKLVVSAGQSRGISFIGIGSHYSSLELIATLPDDMPVQLKVGSGDADVDGTASLSADVGSGDLQASNIRGTLFADVGSGDIDAENVGSLQVLTVGSGDLKVRQIRGSAQVGSVRSGDLEISGAGGDVKIGSVGSGDAEVSDVGGSVSVDSIGSGSVRVDTVRGDIAVDDVGSGSVSHHAVGGRVRVPSED